jgi:hypothetical protein
MQRQAFADLLANRQHRIERACRILKDHGDPPAANPVEFAWRGAEDVNAFQPDATANRRGRRQKTEGSEPRDGLA